MPSEFKWWASASENDDSYTGAYETKELAISHAILNGFYDLSDDGSSVRIYVVEAQVATIEDVKIDADVILTDLATYYEDYCNENGEVFSEITKEDTQELEKALNEAFQKWARYNDIRVYGAFTETRNGEYITMPTPDHVNKILRD